MEASSKLSGLMQKIVYLTQPNILPSESPTVWWGDKALVYLQMAGVARFLSLPVISEPIEPLFNTAGLMYTSQLNRLLTELAGRCHFSPDTILNSNDLN